MKRRQFLALTAAASINPLSSSGLTLTDVHQDHHRTFATPRAAMGGPREKLLYTVGIYSGTKINKPDYLATIDVDPSSPTYSKVIHRLPMPNVGDELHHYGWNACASCHGSRARRFLILPGLVSSRIHIVDTIDPKQPRLVKVIEPAEILQKTKLTAPHTVHCRADGIIMISMLGNENGDGPGGFLLLDEEFNVVGSWAKSREGMNYNYDF